MPRTPVPGAPPARRRDAQKERTRLDLSLAALGLADDYGLANVRIPQVAAAVGVSTRTFNNYFGSKEAAIAWPSTLRAARMASNLADRPPAEPLAEALVATVVGMYGETDMDGLPEGWLRRFRALVAVEPGLHGEYLKVTAAAEGLLAEAISSRTGTETGHLEPLVLAAMVAGAERAAVLYWVRQERPSVPLIDVVREAVSTAVRGIAGHDPTLTEATTTTT